MSSTEVLTESTKRRDQVWSTGAEGSGKGAEEGGAVERGTCRKKKVILVGWDRRKGIMFAALAVSFVVWAAVYFPLTVGG